jgi:hypothetical protein
VVAAQPALGGHGSEGERVQARAQALEQRLGHPRGDQHPVDRVAGLAGVDVALDADHLGHHVEVGVREHDQRAVAAELQGQGLEARRGPGGDALGHGPRAGEGHLVHQRVGAEGLAQARAVPGQTAHHPRRQAGPLGQIAQGPGGQGRLLGRLDHHGAAGGQRRGQLPDHQRHREVPGGDGGHHAHRVRAHPAPRGQRAAGELGGPEARGLAGEVLDHLDRPGHLGPGLGQGLALLGVDQPGDALGLLP